MFAAQAEIGPVQTIGAHHEYQADGDGRDRGDIRPRRGEMRNQVGQHQHHYDNRDVDLRPELVQRR